jgi:hypothetical protein
MTYKANHPVTRRRLVIGTAHQQKDFKASAQRIYEILPDSKQFTACPAAEQ